MGMTPASYRRGGAGKLIRYTFVQTYLGKMLVAGTDKGICGVSFGQDNASMVTLLQAEYPAAELLEDEAQLAAAVAELVKHLEGRQAHISLPLDLQATAFQLRVWEELRRIPYGETRTYAEVAQAMGQPKAVRAVANACAANPAVVVTPCHRVVRSDGSLGGYRYGVERKRALFWAFKPVMGLVFLMDQNCGRGCQSFCAGGFPHPFWRVEPAGDPVIKPPIPALV